MRKLGILIGFGAGYVVGARAGRERYEQIMRLVRRTRNDPRVQKAAHQAAGMAAEQAQHAREATSQLAEQAGTAMKEKASEITDAAKEKLSDSDG